jgi:transcription elongation factor GreB
MSKAFTKEEDDEFTDDVLDAAPAGDDSVKNYITPAGYRRLKDEFSRLWDLERPKLIETISWAASNGDRSENADYLYGKRRLREIDRRLRFLSRRLERAEIVDNAGKDHQRVYFGATVTYADRLGHARTVTIVGADEVDPARGRVSWGAPIAAALLKAREGDRVTLRAPAGAEEIEVIAIRYDELS